MDDEAGSDDELFRRGLQKLVQVLRDARMADNPISDKPFDHVELVVNRRGGDKQSHMYVARGIFSVTELIEMDDMPMISSLRDRPFVKLGASFTDWDKSFIQRHDLEVRQKATSTRREEQKNRDTP